VLTCHYKDVTETQETVSEKSLAPKVLPRHYNEKRLEISCKTDVNVCLFLLF